jgi:CRISPR/Cas system-associated endoribonuclease Cas2
MVHVIAYDLRSPDDKPAHYKNVAAAIEAEGVCKWVQDSVWLLQSEKSSEELRDDIVRAARMDARDRIFIARLDGMWGAQNLSLDAIVWLRDDPF